MDVLLSTILLFRMHLFGEKKSPLRLPRIKKKQIKKIIKIFYINLQPLIGHWHWPFQSFV